jgi:glycosyltransferase involved in cell wall biosynthesis
MLYPTFHHGLATIVLQAMLTGLPVVCIEGDATGRAVGQEAGITVPLNEAEAPSAGIARAIAALSQDEPRRQALAAAARRIALDRYAYETLARGVEAVYEDVLSGRTGPNRPS